MRSNKLLFLIIVNLATILFILKSNQFNWTIASIPVFLLILLYNDKNKYIIGAVAFAILLINLLYIKNREVSDVVEEEVEEGFSNKLRNIKKGYLSEEFASKLRKKSKKHKSLKEKFSDEKGEEDAFNSIGLSDVKYECSKYYNSFSKSPLKKKSDNTKESLNKFKILKEKFLEIF